MDEKALQVAVTNPPAGWLDAPMVDLEVPQLTVKVPAPRPKRIFVAYPYSIPRGDYRRAFIDLAKAFGVEFQFADQQITNSQILDKISEMITSALFSLFDITTWNANVALELGIAIGAGRDYYLLFNPDHPDNPERQVPADLGGLDRIEYHSFTELEEGLAKLLVQEFGVPVEGGLAQDPVRDLRDRVPEVLANEPGLKIGQIADRLRVAVEIAQVVVRPLATSGQLQTTGSRRGTRYYLPEDLPKRPRTET